MHLLNILNDNIQSCFGLCLVKYLSNLSQKPCFLLSVHFTLDSICFIHTLPSKYNFPCASWWLLFWVRCHNCIVWNHWYFTVSVCCSICQCYLFPNGWLYHMYLITPTALSSTVTLTTRLHCLIVCCLKLEVVLSTWSDIILSVNDTKHCHSTLLEYRCHNCRDFEFCSKSFQIHFEVPEIGI